MANPSMTSKQISLHAASRFPSWALVCAPLCAFGIVSLGHARAQQSVVPKNGGQMSILRLVSAGGLRGGTYEAGVDLTMAPGSHTYWKIPGEAGVPPVFTFNGSSNVAAATVSYPVPKRISEEGIDAFGYADGVIFPVAVTPVDRAKPAILHVDVTYAVCNKICLPGHGEASLTLSPRGPAIDGAALAKAASLVPRPAGSAPNLTITRVAPEATPSGSGPAPSPTWTAAWHGGDAPTDIFPVAPEGFFFSSRKIGPTTWTVTAEQSVTAPKSKTVPVTLVLARPDNPTSVEETFDLEAATK